MAKGDRAKLAAVERELDCIGLLLQHDAELPSATALLAGAPIVGSWWGHPLGHQLYDWLSQFEQGAGALSLKLVNGKVTYVAERLWPSMVTLATTDATERAKSLSASAKALEKRVLAVGGARGDDLAGAGFASAKAFTAAVKELEQALLVHVDSVHTASGAHTKVLTPWSGWAAARGVEPEKSLPAARAALSEAAACLGESASRSLLVAFLDVPAKLTRRR